MVLKDLLLLLNIMSSFFLEIQTLYAQPGMKTQLFKLTTP